MKKLLIVIFFVSVIIPVFSVVNAATTATTILSGGLSLTAEYEKLETEARSTDDWSFPARAFLSLNHTRTGKNGGASASYSTSYTYDLDDDTSEWSDHVFNFTGWRDLSKRLRFDLRDNFKFTNDLWAENVSSVATGILPTPPGEDEVEIPNNSVESDEPTFSKKIDQDKFWSNDFLTKVSYQYAKTGSISLGYNNRIFEYDESGRDSYTRNRGISSISYGFTPRWSSSISYSYTDARFDISEDFTSHDTGFSLNYFHSVQDSYYGSVSYYEKNYEENKAIRNNSYTLNGRLGWTHNFSVHKTLSMSVGPSYYKQEGNDGETSVNFNVNFTSQFERGSWYVKASGGLEDTSYDGYDETTGISDYQNIGAGVNWQLAKNLSANLSADIRSDSYQESQQASDETSYVANTSLSYRFSRWFYISGRYRFEEVDADISSNDTTEHRVWITLGFSKELYRW